MDESVSREAPPLACPEPLLHVAGPFHKGHNLSLVLHTGEALPTDEPQPAFLDRSFVTDVLVGGSVELLCRVENQGERRGRGLGRGLSRYIAQPKMNRRCDVDSIPTDSSICRM